MPWPKGKYPPGQPLVFESNGEDQPLDCRELAHWADGTLKWTAHSLSKHIGYNSGYYRQGRNRAGRSARALPDPGRAVTLADAYCLSYIPAWNDYTLSQLSSDGFTLKNGCRGSRRRGTGCSGYWRGSLRWNTESRRKRSCSTRRQARCALCAAPTLAYAISHLSMLFGFPELVAELADYAEREHASTVSACLRAYLAYGRAYNGGPDAQREEYGFAFPPTAAWRQYLETDGYTEDHAWTVACTTAPTHFADGEEARVREYLD
ncbi:polysaccharide lyase family 26 protein [Aspergillus homomorphus CBS 101889]|uniref:Uncharacterized protein n=1 Tax=Aspergillus homomorphus (strain CBS 101889) TaxID=1450537 RepID=A0A395HV21_ASPHC|nr:hypothetical protein BO97DRAFT_425082 [Aspergillus homomorphus CBS 101889]RAL11782.1 hypothetical protein BO97DRAFT_425082 [Aspergillus homomorphus CBS 101889]